MSACLILVSLLPVASLSQAGECLKDSREVKLGKSALKLRSYTCRGAGTNVQPLVHVEFHRLDEVAAGSLLQGELLPELRKVVGNASIIKNDVYTEAKHLFSTFAKSELAGAAFAVATPGGGNASTGYLQRKIWYFTAPTGPDVRKPFDLPGESSAIETKLEWPIDFGFNYRDNDCAENPFNCIYVWRYLRQQDLALYDENGTYIQSLDTNGEGGWFDDYIKLLKYITQSGLPEDFVIIVGTYDECGGFSFDYYPRKLILDVAVVENVSGKPESLDGLIGAAIGKIALRRADKSQALESETGPLPFAAQQLAPGQKVVLPLKMTFVTEQPFNWSQQSAQAVYEKLMRSAKGGVITEDAGPVGEEKKLKKKSESFRSPNLPATNDYIYGPELDLAGLVINGDQSRFEGTSGNYLAFTISADAGSCPVLYAWNEGAATWQRHGKIIHQANQADKESTENVTFPGYVGRFRLSEEELELTHLNSARLSLNLRNGTILVLQPSDDRLKAKDDSYLNLAAKESVELVFELPRDIAKEEVSSSTLSLTAYYRRYGSSLVTRSDVSGRSSPSAPDASGRPDQSSAASAQ